MDDPSEYVEIRIGFKPGDRVATYPTGVASATDSNKPRLGTVDFVFPDGTIIINIDEYGPRACHRDTDRIERAGDSGATRAV